MSRVAVEILVGIVLAIVSTVLAYYFFRPAPLAFAKCEPTKGTTSLTVICYNQSNYYKNIIWDFGIEGLPQIKDIDTVEHKYNSEGVYTISLYAHGKGESIPWKQIISVSKSKELPYSLTVNIKAKLLDNVIVRNRNVLIDQTKSDHPSTFSDHTRNYSLPILAEGGYKIIGSNFTEHSATRATHINKHIQDDGKQLLFSFSLTSGPGVDRYRGWLRGTLTLREERIEPGAEIMLSQNINIQEAGSYTLRESVPLDTVSGLKIYDSNGEVLAEGEPDQVMFIPEQKIALFLLEEEGKLFLRVEPRE
ncbi:hypothetical protein [Enterovibrio calviensis]|uniref:hypothetical protein n=1 Tax=Enterovibrio calviensis TaxID=91359 RepID=UPI000480F1CC|nr:hypothetical protein [Enterovibrio calviensis]